MDELCKGLQTSLQAESAERAAIEVRCPVIGGRLVPSSPDLAGEAAPQGVRALLTGFGATVVCADTEGSP